MCSKPMLRPSRVLPLLPILLIFCSVAEQAPAAEDSSATTDATVAYVTTESFNDEVLAAEVPVLVDFTATWCVPCKVVDPIIESLMPEMAGRAKVFKLDIDESPEIYKQLRVNGVPHVLLFKDGKEQDRISSAQSREIYVEYLEAMINGQSAFGVAIKLLDDDAFRRHFVLSRSIADLQKALTERPQLLVEPFANGQTPLGLVFNRPNFFQDEQIELILAQNPSITVRDLVGLGRCEEFAAAVEEDPAWANYVDPDGNSMLMTAIRRSYRLPSHGCLQAVLNAGAEVGKERNQESTLGRSVVLLEDADLLQEFLDRGMDPEFADGEGRNALHWAAIYGYENIVLALLAHGVDPSVETFDGKTAADLVRGIRDRRLTDLKEGQRSDSPEIAERMTEMAQEYDALLALLEKAEQGSVVKDS